MDEEAWLDITGGYVVTTNGVLRRNRGPAEVQAVENG